MKGRKKSRSLADAPVVRPHTLVRSPLPPATAETRSTLVHRLASCLLAQLLCASARAVVRPWAALRSAAWAHRAWQATGAGPLPPYASHQRGAVYARASRGLGQRAPGVRALAVGGEMAGRRRGTTAQGSARRGRWRAGGLGQTARRGGNRQGGKGVCRERVAGPR